MRSDRKKVNCHDAKAYLPAGELELFAVLVHVHMRACVCVWPVLEALMYMPRAGCLRSLGGRVWALRYLPVVKPLLLKYQKRICNRDQTNGRPSSGDPKGSYSD